VKKLTEQQKQSLIELTRAGIAESLGTFLAFADMGFGDFTLNELIDLLIKEIKPKSKEV